MSGMEFLYIAFLLFVVYLLFGVLLPRLKRMTRDRVQEIANEFEQLASIAVKRKVRSHDVH